MSAEYTLIVADKTFCLSTSQIEHDSPNLFTSHFLDSSDPFTARPLRISRDPYLFEIIMRYLNGYQILPIHSNLVPPYCTPETALADLRADAQFYQLNELSRLLASWKAPEDELVVRYAEITGQYDTGSDNLEPTESLDKVADGFSLEPSSEKQHQTASQHNDFFTVPSNAKDGHPSVFYSGLLNERIVRKVLQRDRKSAPVRNWEVLGWKRDYPSERCRRTSIFVKLWNKSGPITNGNNLELLG
ncbi:hypothetical protein ACGC1H_000181 [Rhizoctonia solani]|uniref:BTB domain-containing protein n=1 Tax=Rhizoctonia solani TaxID=456999 RepID=A0A8H3A207_9AGAM|nr:unnamed protein product [Rhizoctonia solani]